MKLNLMPNTDNELLFHAKPRRCVTKGGDGWLVAYNTMHIIDSLTHASANTKI